MEVRRSDKILCVDVVFCISDDDRAGVVVLLTAN